MVGAVGAVGSNLVCTCRYCGSVPATCRDDVPGVGVAGASGSVGSRVAGAGCGACVVEAADSVGSRVGFSRKSFGENIIAWVLQLSIGFVRGGALGLGAVGDDAGAFVGDTSFFAPDFGDAGLGGATSGSTGGEMVTLGGVRGLVGRVGGGTSGISSSSVGPSIAAAILPSWSIPTNSVTDPSGFSGVPIPELGITIASSAAM